MLQGGGKSTLHLFFFEPQEGDTKTKLTKTDEVFF